MTATVSCTCGWTADYPTVLAAATAPHQCGVTPPAEPVAAPAPAPAPAPVAVRRRPRVALAGGTSTGYPTARDMELA
ncbi:hypothetical protein Ga0074812_14839 [Parafrankia irregularis]|uniref:Uncharacterized protein n=1 Tax=Parafrankia irregularis TaxID=795642 RepID=A0A0S4QZ76_9ACTN|nr:MULTISPECIES: hypothetical protein [Parafrankia]MBE3206764.1 hypothetical protein [Parafrankia sp. CH37]CUU60839.1 hypothetical protein Ga0074812_14839 [Parafrankia irregularis]